MRLVTCLLLPGLALAQGLPLAWPDLPQGALLDLRHSATFTGAGTVATDGGWILAWCDMRDGQGRLMLQKVDPDQPAQAGPWQGGCESLEGVEALCFPPAAITPYLPLLAPDASGGAFVLWQDAINAGQGDLLLQRVSDGPLGQGEAAWPAPLTLAQDITLPTQDCRGPESRCRDWAAAWRQLVPDGQGGVWVCWRDPSGGLLLQHVDAQGALHPGLPATGLALPVESWACQLVGGGQGGARMLCRMTADAGDPLAVLGVEADGSWTLPGQLRVIQPGDMGNFHAAPLEDGRLFLAWTREDGVRAQLLDGALQDLWEPGGRLLDPRSSYNPKVAVGPGDTPTLGVAWSLSEEGALAQRLDLSGAPAWTPPVSLEIVADGQSGGLSAFRADAQGLLYLLHENDGLHLQRLTESGHGLWPLGHTLVSAPDASSTGWALESDSEGGARAGWSLYHAQDRQQESSHRIFHRRWDGVEPVDSLQATFLHERWAYGGAAHFARISGDPLCAWTRSDTLFAQSLDAASGRPQTSSGAVALATFPWLELVATTPTLDGAWLLTHSYTLPDGWRTLHVLRVDSLGRRVAGPVEVAPDLVAQDPFFEVGAVGMAMHDEELVVVFECQLGTRVEIRAQRFDAGGNRLWGDSGILASPPSDGYARLAGAVSFGDGSTALVWTPWNSSQLEFHLQALTPQGQRRFPDNGGRGLALLLESAPFGWESGVQPLADGSLLLTLTDNLPDATTRWRLCRVTSQGTVAWRHTEASSSLTGAKVEVAANGDLWLGRQRMDQSLLRLQVDHRTPEGDMVRVWSLPREASDNLWEWTLSHTSDGHALTLMDWRPDSVGVQVKAWSLPESDATPLWTAAPPFSSSTTWGVRMAPAPQGDAWLLWEERRGLDLGYGEQTRLARLDILEDTPLDDPLRRPAFQLEAAWPNPFNPRTQLAFSVEKPGPVSLELFNVAGQRVRSLLMGSVAAGRHTLVLDCSSGPPLASGLYLLRLGVGDEAQSQRLLLLR